MSDQPENKGILHIQTGKKGRSFQVSYTNLKGRESRMPVQEKAVFFDKEKAAEGDEVLFVLNSTGQIEKCSIPGKEAVPATPASGTEKQGARGRNAEFSSGRQPFRGGSRQEYGNRRYGQMPSGLRKPALCDAVAPYNFISYEPGAVLEEKGAERGHWSGVLHCRLEALTPLLVAGERLKRADESSECRFFTVEGRNVIPGSSIKGVLRTLVEILSFSAMRQVSRRESFWRIVTGAAYREAFTDEILGGYLRRHGADYELFPVVVEKVKHGEGPLSGGERVQTGGMTYRDRKTGALRHSADYRFSPPSGKSLPVAREVVADFERQMTEEQKKRWCRERCLKGYGHPVFYRKDADGAVAELGLCRYFRLKYHKSPADLARSVAAVDFAETLFGRVGEGGAIKGRVAVEPVFVEGREYRPGGCCAVLGTPHTTSLAHYIVQNPSSIRTISGGAKNDPESLAAYRSGEKLRGWKMYWHHDVDESLWFSEEKVPLSKKVLTWLHPLAAGAVGDVNIRIDRLTDVELGAVLEALCLSGGNHAVKLGMGKPLGLCSVKLELVHAEVEDTRTRYASLVNRVKGVRPCLEAETQASLRAQFRKNRLERLHELGWWREIREYDALPSIRELHAMTDFTRRPAPDKVRYMSLSAFKKKALLVAPEAVLK